MIILVLSFIFACFACEKEDVVRLPIPTVTDTIPPTDTMPAKDSIPVTDSTATPSPSAKFLALGDSYTIGHGVGESERFPAQTVQLLKALNISVNTPDYIAQTGWTTDNLMHVINLQKPAADYDIVTLLIGVNDQYQWGDTAGYRAKFEALLNKAVYFTGGKKEQVFVLSIPDYSVTPFVGAADKERVSIQIDQFNEINKNITLGQNIAYINITPSTREASSDASLIASDGLHPSGKEYKKWAEKLAPLIENTLK
jgi:lysophospholipase L1-like esterase